jgi:hypothetical protein
MYAKLMRAERGQALVETVVFLPMFLLALFGIMWAVQAAVQNERVQSTVRYNGMILQHDNPYASYSLYAMYAQLGTTTVPNPPCPPPIADPLSDASPTYTSGTSAPFWSPSINPIVICIKFGTHNIGTVGIPAGTGLNQDLLLSTYGVVALSFTSAPAQLQAALGAFTLTRALATFFQPVGVNVILACYPTLNTQIQNSLQYTNDSSTATMPTALGSSPTSITPTVNTDCTGF